MTELAYINPYKLFYGAIVPNWLLERRELSQGAKLAYARLCQYAAKDGTDEGTAWPRRETLADELGVTARQVDRYLKELENNKLIHVDRPGLTKSNRYRFPTHTWMPVPESTYMSTQESTHTSSQDSTDTSTQERTDTSTLIIRNLKESFNGATNDKPSSKVSHLNGHRGGSKPSPTPGHQLCTAEYHDLFMSKFGAKPDIAGKRDGNIISGLVKAHGADEVIEQLRYFFHNPPDWVNKGDKFTIPAFKSAYNEVLAKRRNRKSQMGVL
jgi:hypothetical protein